MKPVVSLDEWMKWYNWIIEYMGFDPVRDRDATVVLSRILYGTEPQLHELDRLIRGNVVIVFGAGPSLPHHIRLLVENGLLDRENVVLVAADGASRALVENNVVPHIVVSDLDGGDDLLYHIATRDETYMFIHGHGDNIDKIISLTPRLLEKTRKIIGTTQVEPVYPVMNFGGFTDGDRAVFITAYFNPKAIVLAGMDFGDIVGKYSKPWLRQDTKASITKKKKLSIARRLIEEVVLEKYRHVYSLLENTIDKASTIHMDQLIKLIS